MSFVRHPKNPGAWISTIRPDIEGKKREHEAKMAVAKMQEQNQSLQEQIDELKRFVMEHLQNKS